MSEKLSTIEKPKSDIINKAKKAGALVFSTFALGGLAAPSAHAEQDSIKPSNKEFVHPKLKNVSELPGYKINVGPEMRSRLQASTVEIIKNVKISETESFWFPNCTGVKVTFPGSIDPYIMTARHCFPESTNTDGSFLDPLNPQNKAENFINRSPFTLGVADPSVAFDTRLRQPMALMDGLSINTNYKDLALLRPAQKGGPAEGRNFDDIPSIDLKISEKAPVPGEQVALYGVPSAAGFEPVIGTGRVIGRMRTPTGKKINGKEIYTLEDVVAINPPIPQKDVCNFGASGSMAIRSDGSMLGPLTARANGGYGPNKEMQPGVEMLGENKENSDYWINYVQQSLGVNIKSYSTICFYTVLDKTTSLNLLNGFNTFAPDLKPENTPPSEGKG